MTQIRSRREASRRMPPLAGGYRDPIDGLRRPRLSVESARQAWLHLRDARLMDVEGFTTSVLRPDEGCRDA